MSDKTPPVTNFWTNGPARWIVFAAIVIVVVIVAVAVWQRNTGHNAGSATPSSSSSPSDSPAPILTPSSSSGSTSASPGSVHTPAPPVPMTATPTVAPGVQVSITKLKSVHGTAEDAGDIAGPAVQVTMTVRNSTGAAIALNSAVVSLYYSKALTPAPSLPGPGGKPFPNSVAAGSSVTGVFIFTVPVGERNNVTITFDYSVAAPILVFHGSVPA